MYDVFISYPRAERTKAERIKRLLREQGFSVFFDIEGIDGGAVFPVVIDKAVKSAKAVLGCWCPLAFDRSWVMQECRVAKARGVLVPIALRPFEAMSVPTEFFGMNYLDLTDFEGDESHEGWTRTVAALRRFIDDPLALPMKLGPNPRTGTEVNLMRGQEGHIVSDGEIIVVVPDSITPEDVTLSLALKLIQNRERDTKALRDNEVEVRFVRRWGGNVSDLKLLFRQIYSVSELRYCQDEFLKGLKEPRRDWNVAVRGLLEWAKEPHENMWYSVDLSLAAAAMRAFPHLAGRDRCIIWFEQSGNVAATRVREGEPLASTVRLGVLPVKK